MISISTAAIANRPDAAMPRERSATRVSAAREARSPDPIRSLLVIGGMLCAMSVLPELVVRAFL